MSRLTMTMVSYIWLLGLQDLAAEHQHFILSFPADSEQKGLLFWALVHAAAAILF